MEKAVVKKTSVQGGKGGMSGEGNAAYCNLGKAGQEESTLTSRESPQAGPALYPGTGGLISAVCIIRRSNSPFSPGQAQPPAEAQSRRSH